MNLLLAEDEHALSRALVAVLTHQDYRVDAVYDGQAAVEMAEKNPYDCLIFDIMMPRKDGVTALKEIRAAGNMTPALFLTAKSETDDKVSGLDAGADDYLTKPFSMEELLARIRSLTRRSGEFMPRRLTVGRVTLDTAEQELQSQNAVRLAGKESRLMEILMRNPGKSFTTEELFRNVWHDEPDTDPNIVWVYISYLRTKLRSIDANVGIEGQEGGSFRLVAEPEA